MNKYISFGPKDFALDESFQRWVLSDGIEGAEFWAEFLTQFPEKKSDVERAKDMVLVSGLTIDAEVNKHFLEVWNVLDKNATERSTVRKYPLVYASIAAAVVALVVLAVYTLFPSNSFDEYRSAYGETKEIRLEDGSVITLNANSKVKVSSDYMSGDDRAVFVEGEAYFDVQKFQNKTFTVSTSKQVGIKVLGTRFNVNTRREGVSVFLESGKVSLTAPENELMLAPGQTAAFDNATRRVFLVNVALPAQQNKMEWRRNLFVYDDIPASQIFQEIEDNFGVKVIVSGKGIMERRVTARIPAGNLELLLKVVSEALEVKMVRNNAEVTVTSL